MLTLSTENTLMKRAVRRPPLKGVLIPPPHRLYAFFLLPFFPLLAATLLATTLLATTPSAADDAAEPNVKRAQAQKGHVFTSDDLVFDTVSMEESETAPKLTHHNTISITANYSTDNLSRRFSRFYEPVQISVGTTKSGYPLPIDEDDIRNFNQVLDQTNINYYGRKKFLEQGFLSVNFGDYDDFIHAYQRIEERGLAPFITSDSVLHLYQLHLSAILSDLEEFTLASDLENLTQAFVNEFDGHLSEVFSVRLNLPAPSSNPSDVDETAAKDLERKRVDLAFQEKLYATGLAYFSTALALIDSEAKIHPAIEDLVRQELALIQSRPGKQLSPILGSEVDYRLFQPLVQPLVQPHKPRSQGYHNALTWYRNMPIAVTTAIMVPDTVQEPASDSVPNQTSRIQPILAATIVGFLGEMELQTSAILRGELTREKMRGYKIWERMVSIYGYFDGTSLEIGPVDLITTLRKVFPKQEFSPLLLNEEDSFHEFMQELQSSIPALTDDSSTKAFYLFGTSSYPEEEIFHALTHPLVKPRPRGRSFTTFYAEKDNHYLRAYPRGLDLLSVLGIQRAAEILESENDANYPNYSSQIEARRKKIAMFTAQDWHQNRYWSWLYVLKTLIQSRPSTGDRDQQSGFMLSDSWQDRKVHTALSSSIAMHQTPGPFTRSDYSKESETRPSTAEADSKVSRPHIRRGAYHERKRRGEIEKKELAAGYVDPLPHVYAELTALTRMIHKGLLTFGALDKNSERRLLDLETLLVQLQEIAQHELANQKLSEDEYSFIHSFAENFVFATSTTDPSSRSTISLNHPPLSTPNTEVLHEASGLLRMILIVYKHPSGQLTTGAGPISTYYEFKRTPDKQMNSGDWRKYLERGKQVDPPEWTESFFQ